MARPGIPPRTVLGLLLAVGLLLIVPACGGSHSDPSASRRPSAATAASAPARSASLTVQGAATGPAVPSGFVGLSMEFRGLAAYAGSDPRAVDPVFLNLIRDIAPDQRPILRVGGDSSDWTWWPVAGAPTPGGVKYDLTPQYLSVARSVAEQTSARLILGINLEADSTTDAAAEGRAMVQGIGREYIDALEIGNEPELYRAFAWYRTPNGARVYGRPTGWDPAEFVADYSGFTRALPQVTLAGPSSGSAPWLADLGAFLRAEPRVRLATIHAYPLKHCSPSSKITIAQLLAASSSSGFAQMLAPYVAVAHANGKQIRIDELNAVSCGGERGVSDSFASSLWMLDTLFELQRTGVDGVNVHTIPGSINEVLGPSFAHGRWSIRVHPEYYGMIMFARAAPPGSRLLTVSSAAPAGVKVWATEAANGQVRVLLINERSRAGQTMALRVPAAHGPAAVEVMRAPSIDATTGVTIGGQGFGTATATGLLGAPTPDSLAAVGGVYQLRLPAASATLLTFSPPAGAARGG